MRKATDTGTYRVNVERTGINLIDMTWRWRYETENGKPVEGPRDEFTSQADAESWLGQNWRDLLPSGAVTAVLVEDERVEYKMPLTA